MSFFDLFGKSHKPYTIEELLHEDRLNFNTSPQQIWTVKWKKRTGSYSSDTEETMEAFLSKEAAELFATKLKDAQKLLRNSESLHITIGKLNG